MANFFEKIFRNPEKENMEAVGDLEDKISKLKEARDRLASGMAEVREGSFDYDPNWAQNSDRLEKMEKDIKVLEEESRRLKNEENADNTGASS